MPAQEILPSNIAKTPDIEALAQISTDIKALNDTLLYFVSAILDKLPRLDTNDRVASNIETGTLTSVGTVSTVTTCSTVTNLTSLNNWGTTGNAVWALWNLSDTGATRLYNNITVT